jgi:hypothetical protein
LLASPGLRRLKPDSRPSEKIGRGTFSRLGMSSLRSSGRLPGSQLASAKPREDVSAMARERAIGGSLEASTRGVLRAARGDEESPRTWI